ncbi:MULTISPECIES: hypothetical protein [Delftia]|uniref:Uncharacterized protein n=1 Tax=Delftia lacustris TaxID=558537 RepID=A0A7T2YRQ7_9BURK|nr:MULTISPECIES: hypothetical protein [Delftia]QPS80923.1 hypothetical protein I6G47_28780 [Delftia lacustris]
MAIFNSLRNAAVNAFEMRTVRKEVQRMREILGIFDEGLGAYFNSFALTELQKLENAKRLPPDQFEFAAKVVRQEIYERYARYRPC